jgi:hypothetical protein
VHLLLLLVLDLKGEGVLHGTRRALLARAPEGLDSAAVFVPLTTWADQRVHSLVFRLSFLAVHQAAVPERAAAEQNSKVNMKKS